MYKMRGNFTTDRNGCKNPNYKDGRKGTRLYSIYTNMITRCYNHNFKYYHRYGGRRITVCDEWKNDFKSFYNWAMANGYNDTLTIDRIDNDKGYEPSNCRWTTHKVQANNRSSNHLVTIFNRTKSLKEWCDIYSINYQTVQDRLKRGWNIERALMEPVQKKVRKRVV